MGHQVRAGMARIIGYIAASLDGFIAAEGNSMDWLSEYEGMDLGTHGFARFMAGVRTIVMGRATYDFIEKDDADWPYGTHRVYVVTSRPIASPKGPIVIRQDIDELVQELRGLDDGQVWMLGGGRLQMAFIERNALDEIEIYIFPRVLGGGTPLFPATGLRRGLRLINAVTLDRGCVRLHYSFA
jgi:dihydrofolate reductase